MDSRSHAGDNSEARARHVPSDLSGYTGYTGYRSDNIATGKRETAVTAFSAGVGETGYTGYTPARGPLTAYADLDAALRLPVRHLVWLPARLTYRMSHALGNVAWTTHTGAYAALRGSWAAFSPREYEAAVAAGESGVATGRQMAAWVQKKLASPKWRLGSEEALRWGPRERLAGFGWWEGSEWCQGHEVTTEAGWTVGYACALFGLTPVSVEVHAADAAKEGDDAAA